MSAFDLDEFLPERPQAKTSARPQVSKSSLHLDEFAPEISPEPPPEYASLSNGWKVTLIVGGGLAFAVILSYLLFMVAPALHALVDAVGKK
jgi:hypothetical protein